MWPHPRPRRTHTLRVAPETESLILPAQNYVLLRRFSAKEEPRRLTASVFNRSALPAERIAFENHLNYIYHSDRELTEFEAIGICAVLNSRLFDAYFRTISGNTQVNAAEIRTMPFPSLSKIEIIGRVIAESPIDDAPTQERIVHHLLDIQFEPPPDNGSMNGKPRRSG